MAKPFSPFLTNHSVSSICLISIKIQIGLTHSKLFCTRLGYPMQGCIALSACACLYLDPLSLLILLTYISSCFWNHNWIISVSFCFCFYFHFLYLCSLYSISIIFVLLCSLSILFLSCAGAWQRVHLRQSSDGWLIWRVTCRFEDMSILQLSSQDTSTRSTGTSVTLPVDSVPSWAPVVSHYPWSQVKYQGKPIGCQWAQEK